MSEPKAGKVYILVGHEELKDWKHPREKEILAMLKDGKDIKEIRKKIRVCYDTVECVRVKHGMKTFMKKQVRQKKGIVSGSTAQNTKNSVVTSAWKTRYCRRCGLNAYPNYFYCPKCQREVCGTAGINNSCMVF